ncbi:MAG: FAD-dependent monooxygenase [Gordonia amarae]
MNNVTGRIKVAVVGGGPTGLTVTALLRQAGVSVSLYEQEPHPCKLPQAHQLNPRTGEIFRQAGVFDALDTLAPPDERTRHVLWAESMKGRIYGGIEWPAWDPEITACRAMNIAQDLVEVELARRVEELGYDGGFGYRVSSVTQQDSGAQLEIHTPSGDVVTKDYDYVLACDGASSSVRRGLGIEMMGPPSLARFVTCYFRADLYPLIKDRPGPLRIIADAGVWGTIIGYDVDKVWAFMSAIPEGTDAAEYTEPVMREFIARAIGDRDVDFTIDGITTWNMSAQIAAEFRSGPVFLLGDAAHRFPPTGGLGLNTGVQDAHNIAWKLAWIDRGMAGPELLDTYQPERQLVAQRNCDQSVANAVQLAGIDQVLVASALAPLPPEHALSPAPANEREFDDAVAQEAFDALRNGIDFTSLEFGYTYPTMPGDGRSDLPFPAARIGGLVPHIPLDTPSGPRSLIEVYDKVLPTLITVDPESEWVARVTDAADRSGLPVTFLSLNSYGDDAVALWSARAGVGLADAVLVRPDGHVAWVSPADGTDSVASLQAALDQLTGSRQTAV